MYYEITCGHFKSEIDTLSLRGSFNGWSDQWIMMPTAEPTVYSITKTFTTFVGEVFNYKFVFRTISDTIWEGDPNKTYTITDSDISTGTAVIFRVFNYAVGPTIHPASKIKYTVNMSNATSSINLQPFSSVNSVKICGDKIPLRWPSGGWPDADSIFAINLYDDGTNGDILAGDNIWSKDLNFPFNTHGSVKYKYSANWGLQTNNGGNENESSSGTYHSFDIPPNILVATVVDTFGIMGENQLTNKIILDVEDTRSTIISSYSLSQNYPNPFNPITKIRYTIPNNVETRHGVSLGVYDVFGNEVATLVDEYKPTGSYEIEFSAKGGLASGIYFYQMRVNDFVATKKMIFLK
jgi:hypothetical protein